MVEFIAGILSSLSANLSNSPLSVIKENSKFNKLFKSVVSNEKAKCFAAVGKAESVKTTLVQCEVFFFIPIFYFRYKNYSYSFIQFSFNEYLFCVI